MSTRKYTKKPLESRFWSKVNKDGPIPKGCPELGKCWEWAASCMSKGYGSFGFNYKKYLSHRIAWELTYGTIPDGLQVLHRCDNRKCANPAHLFLGTPQINMDDMIQKGRQVHPGAMGERNGSCKLTDAQVAEIRSRYAAGGITQDRLGHEMGVSGTQISHIVRNIHRKAKTPDTGSRIKG